MAYPDPSGRIIARHVFYLKQAQELGVPMRARDLVEQMRKRAETETAEVQRKLNTLADELEGALPAQPPYNNHTLACWARARLYWSKATGEPYQ